MLSSPGYFLPQKNFVKFAVFPFKLSFLKKVFLFIVMLIPNNFLPVW
ncbi:hypothetical protein E4N74_12885 [Treponema putidum]|uniref:Uncharacterized protein n=1 Tax=Treponema putidum TaxID=221027 RepID=A0AAE9MY22_9SPIR|nr:hypothetical protein E4N74_12885 [Treponema putidum]